MEADAALVELLEVSPQIVAAVVADRTGAPVAYRFRLEGSKDAAARLGALGVQILDAADQSRTELGREPVVQAEIGAGTGNVFVVTDERHIGVAITNPEPTIGLVFYDLKTALRTIRSSVAPAETEQEDAK